MNDFNKSYKKVVSKEDKFWSLLINYRPTIPKIYSLPKTRKLDIPLRPVISGRGLQNFQLNIIHIDGYYQ